MNAPIREPMAPRMTVSRTLMSCFPGSTSRASGPTIAPATRAARMVPIMSTLPPSSPQDGRRRPGDPGSFLHLVPAWSLRATPRRRTCRDAGSAGMTKAADRGGRRPSSCLDGPSSGCGPPGGRGGRRGRYREYRRGRAPRTRAMSAEADARLALGTRRHVADRGGRDHDATALVVGQLEGLGAERRLDGGEDLVAALGRLEGDLACHVLHADADLHVKPAFSVRWTRSTAPVVTLTSAAADRFPGRPAGPVGVRVPGPSLAPADERERAETTADQGGRDAHRRLLRQGRLV